MKTIVSLFAVITIVNLLFCQPLSAQSALPATSSSPVADGTPVPLTEAVVSAFVERKTLSIHVKGGNPVNYQLAKGATFVASNGSIIDGSTLKPGTSVAVHFMTDGDHSIIDRVFVH